MEIHCQELDNGIRLLKLTGKPDSRRMDEIEARFTAYCAGEKARVLVDLSDVDDLTARAVRLLTVNAKSLAFRHGRMVLWRPTENVKKALETAGIPSLIPIYDGFESAETVLLAL